MTVPHEYGMPRGFERYARQITHVVQCETCQEAIRKVQTGKMDLAGIQRCVSTMVDCFQLAELE